MNRPRQKKRLPARPHPPTPSPRAAAAATDAGPQRIQKLLAASGVGSRREIEAWIAAGRVTLDGKPVRLGDRARPGDAICVDGQVVRQAPASSPTRVLAYHKPVGELVTRRDPDGRPTVFARLPPLAHSRWVPIGRLDFNTSGLLLLTTSGELANRLMHPRHAVEREYHVRVLGRLDAQALRALTSGVRLEDGPAALERIEPLRDDDHGAANRWYRAILREGRKREVRRLIEAVGARVSRLVRVRYGPVTLPRDLAAGRWRELSAAEVARLGGGRDASSALSGQ